jgi:hypothetical protein
MAATQAAPSRARRALHMQGNDFHPNCRSATSVAVSTHQKSRQSRVERTDSSSEDTDSAYRRILARACRQATESGSRLPQARARNAGAQCRLFCAASFHGEDIHPSSPRALAPRFSSTFRSVRERARDPVQAWLCSMIAHRSTGGLGPSFRRRTSPRGVSHARGASTVRPCPRQAWRPGRGSLPAVVVARVLPPLARRSQGAGTTT